MLEFHPYSRENAEIVLTWRNSENVRVNSKSQGEIGLEQHLQFLQKILNDANLRYYLVSFGNEPIATINFQIKNDSVYWGCAIGAGDRVIPGLFPLLVGIACKFTFEFLEKKYLDSEVLVNNLAPQKLNLYLSIPEIGRSFEDGIELIHYRLEKLAWQDISEGLKSVLPLKMQQELDSFSPSFYYNKS